MKSYQSKRRRKGGSQPGNLNADGLGKFTELAVTGSNLVSKEQLTVEIESVMDQKGLKVEIAMLRYIMMKLMQFAIQVDRPEELLHFTRGLGFAGEHLARMLLAEKQLDGGKDEFYSAWLQATTEVLQEVEEQKTARSQNESSANV